ncbi:TIM barrel protein [Oxalobacteraceae bacterium OTU3CAMAD1]|nr:TIM barrel protein [Oxalobacteraceae bacterium OTU3CAMAD1]
MTSGAPGSPTRRRLLAALASMAALAASPVAIGKGQAPLAAAGALRGRLRQGITPHLFCATMDETCRMAAALGIRGLDFASDPADWPLIRQYGLTVSLLRVDYGGGISRPGRAPAGPPGWNAIGTPDRESRFEAALRDRIDAAADNQIPSIIVTCGERGAIGYDEGKRNAIAFLRRVAPHAEARKVLLVMENINTGHTGGPPAPPGSMFDHLPWGLDVATQVGSPAVKLLVDLYHAQLMDGNLTNFLRDHMPLIGHFHTGGVPGRHEIDETQELNYRHLATTIADLGFQGFVSHEWAPSAGRDKVAMLRKCVGIIDV